MITIAEIMPVNLTSTVGLEPRRAALTRLITLHGSGALCCKPLRRLA